MTSLSQKLSELSAAEDFLDFFGIPYEERVVDVCRLHILKRFYQYLRHEAPGAQDDTAVFKHYRMLLARAYEDFLRSTPGQEKVFKVFQEVGGQHRVSVDTLRASLPARAD